MAHMEVPEAAKNAITSMCPDYKPSDGLFQTALKLTPAPRTIKTHLPFPLYHPKFIDTSKVLLK